MEEVRDELRGVEARLTSRVTAAVGGPEGGGIDKQFWGLTLVLAGSRAGLSSADFSSRPMRAGRSGGRGRPVAPRLPLPRPAAFGALRALGVGVASGSRGFAGRAGGHRGDLARRLAQEAPTVSRRR